MNIVFLDIDGVLNSLNYFIEREPKVLELYQNENYNKDTFLKLKRLMLDIDINKVKVLKEIIDETKSLVVVISSWKNMGTFSYVQNELIKMGIPIIGITDDCNSNRGAGIKNYLQENNVQKYIILDDEIFDDYDVELLSHLVKTSFNKNGLTNKHKSIAIKMMINNNIGGNKCLVKKK